MTRNVTGTSGDGRPRSERGRRLYDWWSRHRLARRLLYAAAFTGRESTFRRRGVDALAPESGERVLELGCGPGTNFAALRDRVGPGGRVVGVDYSRGMVERARRRVADAGWANVHAVRADAATLPLSAGSFDAAYASMSLSAMPDLAGTLRETRRVLRPGGRLAALDARRFRRAPWTALNPLVAAAFSLTTNWYPERDLDGALRSAFPEVSTTEYQAGSILVATARTGTD